MKQFFRNYYINILSFFIPIVILLIVCAVNNIFPLGENYLNAYDGNLQHTGFVEYFKNVVLGNESLFYSFKGGLGYNFYAVFIYYLCSPLNLISIFFSNEYIYIFYTIILILKIGLCGLSCSILLKYFNKKDKYIILFSICYALTSYNLLYMINIMWLDSVIMLPIVILGIEKLIKENKKVLYLISLSLAIIFNFYLGFMICIFSVIYFIYKYLVLDKVKRNKKIIKKFIISSLLSGLICTIILLPVVLGLLNGKIDGFSEDYQTDYFVFSLDFFSSFYKITPGAFTSQDISYGTPNIYTSLFIISLVFIYFFNTKVAIKEKIIIGSILAFYLLCFSFNLFDYAWHMFQRPIWYPNRYSFTLSLFLIIIAYKSFNKLDGIKINKYLIASVIALIIIVFSSALYNDIKLNNEKIFFVFLSILLLIDYLFVYTFNKNLKYIIVIFLIIELSLNTYYVIKNIGHSTTVDYYKTEIKSMNKKLEIINDFNNDFDRIEFNSVPNYNNGALFSYNGLNFFSSIRNNKAMNYLEKTLGANVIDGCSVKYSSINPIINTYLGIKYFDAERHEDYYQPLKQNKNLYYNDLAEPLFYVSKNNLYKTKLKDFDYINNFENIYKSVVNDNSTLIDEDFKLSSDNLIIKDNYIYNNGEFSYLTYKKEIKESGWLVFYDINEFKFYNPNIYVNGKIIEDSINKKVSLFLKKGDKVKIKYKIGSEKVKRTKVKVYFVKYNSLKNYSESVNNNKIKIIKYDKDNYIKTNVNINNKSILATQIPYDNGWSVYIDGKKVKKKLLYNTFIGVDITKGNHIVEFKYTPPGFIIGLIISLMASVTSIFYIKKKE